METEKKSSGTLIGLIIIVIIIIIGGLYLWQLNKKTDTINPVQSESITTQDSSELDALQQNLETTNVDIGASAIESVQ